MPDAADDPSISSSNGPTVRDARTWRRRFFVQLGVTVGVVALVVVGSLTVARGFGSDPGSAGASGGTPVLNEPAPPLAGETLEGEAFDVDDYDGQVRVVNVWASWCTVCEEEHPHLLAAAERLRPYGVQFVGLNTMDRRKEALEMTQDMAEETGVEHYPNVFDPDGDLAVEWGVYGIPETFVLDADGRVRAKQVGAVTESWLLDHAAEILTES